MKKNTYIFFAASTLLIIISYLAIYWNTQSGHILTTNSLPEASPGTVHEPDENFTIGWSVYNSAFEFFQAMQSGVLEEAEALGINVIIHDQKSSTSELITGATALIEQNVDALVLSPFNPEAMVIITPLAKEKGIPVIVVDVGTGGTDVDAFIVSDSFGGGIYAGEYALKLIKEHDISSKNIAIIKVEETSEFARRRGDGFKSVMLDNGYNLAAEVTANSLQDQAYDAMKNILASQGDDLAVVFAENDNMALGAAKAIDEAGKKGQILVIGFDGDPAAITAIKEGSMQGTIAQQPYQMGALGVEYAYRILKDEPIYFDDPETKQLYSEIFLIDETGTPVNSS